MRKFQLFICVLAGILLLSACGAPNLDILVEDPEPAVDPTLAEIDSFFQTYVNTDERPIAIMVDNDDKSARPHAGLDESYLIYELPVEGGATRFMALYRGTNTEKIGPIRSARHYFLDYVMEHDGIYTHFGWSPKAISDISAFNINKINGILGTDEKIFWREEKFRGDYHSAYTKISGIKEMAEDKGYKLTTDRESGIKYADTYFTLPAENAATTIDVNYSGFYQTGYTYNAETGLYEKTIHKAPHVMQNGKVLALKNVLVCIVPESSLGDGSDRRELYTTGSGKGYYFTGGAYETITWHKSSRSGNTNYLRADGTPLYINPGNTMINIVSPQGEIIIQ